MTDIDKMPTVPWDVPAKTTPLADIVPHGDIGHVPDGWIPQFTPEESERLQKAIDEGPKTFREWLDSQSGATWPPTD